MTYREALYKKVLISFRFYLIGTILCVASIKLLHFLNAPGIILIPLGIIIFIMPFIAGEIGVKCGKCNYPYRGVSRLRIKYGSKQNRINFCPHCGIGLDEEML